MAYISPSLKYEVILSEQVSGVPALDVTLCEPKPSKIVMDGSVDAPTADVLLAAGNPSTNLVVSDSSINVTSTLQLNVTDNAVYAAPPLDVFIILPPSLAIIPPLDVILCRPKGDESKRIGVTIDTGSVIASGDLSLSAELPEPRYVTLDSAVGVQSTIALSATEFIVGIAIDSEISNIVVSSEIVGTYDSNVFRGAMLDKSGSMQQSKLQGINRQVGFENNDSLKHDVNADWQQAKLISIDSQAQFEANIKLTTSEQVLTETANRVSVSSGHDSEYSELIGQSKSLLNEQSKLVGQGQWYGFEAMLARQTERKIQGEYSYLDAIMRHSSSEYGKLAGKTLSSLAETAKLPSWFTGYLPPPLWQTIILREQLVAPILPLDVVLCAPRRSYPHALLSINNKPIPIHADLILTAEYSDEPQPQKGVIFVTNSVSLVRSDDGREIKLLGFSVGIDSNSYTWSFSATVPLSELSKVDTAREPRIGVDFTCNGNLWRFILDSCDDSISFGESSLTIKGKSRAMLLAHPYATQRGFKFDTAMSARQIAEAELNRNGVASGFTLDWQLAGVNGWNVPANTYSYTGKTPINSLQWIAEAAGGFINADMSADVLHVLAHYPIPSWEWAAQTPSINLTQSLITSRSRGRVNKPDYNGVTIYGENDNGIGALIKRTGTSGGCQPPMVTSDLMTDTAAAISRGKMILSDTGDIGNIGISMPLIDDIGVLKPSTLIGVNDGEQWVGMVRGTTITGRLSSNRALEIDQSIDVERHFDKEIV